MKKRFLSLLLAAFCVAGSFTACGPQDKGPEYKIDETKFNVIDADGTSKYTIVRAENAPGSVLNACMNLKNTILEVTGVEIETLSPI